MTSVLMTGEKTQGAEGHVKTEVQTGGTPRNPEGRGSPGSRERGPGWILGGSDPADISISDSGPQNGETIICFKPPGLW